MNTIDTNTILTVIGLIIAGIAAYIAHLQLNRSDISPVIKVEPANVIVNSSKKDDDVDIGNLKVIPPKVDEERFKVNKLDDKYYEKLGVEIERSKNFNDSFNIEEI